MKNKIEELLGTATPTQILKGKKLLESNDVLSVKFLNDAGNGIFEAMIAYRGGILMPYFMTGDDDALVCQCEKNDTLCVHKVALLLAAKFMRELDCPDYHAALKQSTAQVMEQILNPLLKS